MLKILLYFLFLFAVIAVGQVIKGIICSIRVNDYKMHSIHSSSLSSCQFLMYDWNEQICSPPSALRTEIADA